MECFGKMIKVSQGGPENCKRLERISFYININHEGSIFRLPHIWFDIFPPLKETEI